MQINGSWYFSDPLDRSTFNGGGGGPEWNFTLAGTLSIRGMNPLVSNPTAYYCLTYLVTS
jgi:hypothetical protein